ncbi:MAG: DNA helicase II / ATP-dependent DNA helicase PcrA [Parcubacteria group bacterium Gr01-1014_49]|nr:MAG: DNA helicase II / ATP-dependent DNA helicase PcrA [Parcubacteria group bacterium Gr01-1014_49]
MRYIRSMNYLDGLNEAQKQAVLSKEGPISVLAGAGSGKTRVLTTRIYHLVREGVPPEQILAVTFTNKAAREMRERVRAMLGDGGAVPFIATFHGLGRELLESYGKAIGIPRFFSVYDRDDSEKAIATALKALDVETKELSPRAVLGRISRAKGEGMRAQEFYEKHARGGFGARIAAEAWLRYEKTLAAEKALDFDDLIALPLRLLEEHADIRALAQDRWQYLHIDEYQDTNALQGRLANILAAKHRNLFVVGDIDQCLVAGTEVDLPDGSKRAIEMIKKGDAVLSNYGSGDMRPARVTRVVSKKVSGKLVRITTRNGRVLTSTVEHMHFAGYRLGLTPQIFFTYLMHKRGKGWRLGVSQTYTKGQYRPMIGFQQRCNHEHGDAVWIIGTHENSQEARVLEYTLSLRYAIPTLPFVARKGSVGGYAHDQKVLDDIFASFDTERGAKKLLKDRGLLKEYPHHRAQATRSDRRNIVVALCGEHRGTIPMHRISIVGSDNEGKRLLQNAGFSVRSAKKASLSWRFETAYKEYGALLDTVRHLKDIFPDAYLVRTARLGGKKVRPKDGNSLPFLPAASVCPGMVLFDAEGGFDVVEEVRQIRTEQIRVYDLDIEHTHNFIANGLVTHNCIYTWRGASVENLLEFDKQYADAQTIILERNYRSTKNLVDAANAVIEKNKNRKEKYSTTEQAAGEPIVIHMARSAEDEARWIALKIRDLMRNGVPPEEIAILFRTNFQSRALEEGLLKAGVPYKLLGTHFFARKEVKDALAWIRLAMDPSREADKLRAASSPPRGLGKVTLGKLAAGQRSLLRAGELAKVEQFEHVVQELSLAAVSLVPSEFVKLVIEKSGMYRALFEEGSADDRERFENVEELASVAARHDGTPGKEGIATFLAEAALASDQDELDRDEKKGVTLMTVHAAKGLEFGTVFVSGMEEGLFPHQGMGGDNDRDEEEERRLFYVAMTRAKERLFLTLARVRKIYGSDFASEPSSFLADISGALVLYDETNEEATIDFS